MPDEKPYRERVTLEGDEASKRAEQWIKEHGTFIGVKALDGITVGAHYLMELGGTITYEHRLNQLSAEVIAYDTNVGRSNLARIVSMASNEES